MNTGDTAWVSDLIGPGPGDDDSGAGLLLRRTGAEEKRSFHFNAVFHHHLRHQPAVGPLRLFAGLRAGYRMGDHRQPEMGGTQLCRRAAERRLCGDDSASGLHDLSGDVRRDHAGADHRRLCGADEILRLSDLHRPVGDACLRSPGALGLGNRAAGSETWARWILPAASSSMSVPGFRP